MRSVHTWLRARQPARVIISVDVNYISETRDTGFTVSWNIVTMDRRDIIMGEMRLVERWPQTIRPRFWPFEYSQPVNPCRTLSTSFDSLGAFIDPSGSNLFFFSLKHPRESEIHEREEKIRYNKMDLLEIFNYSDVSFSFFFFLWKFIRTLGSIP